MLVAGVDDCCSELELARTSRLSGREFPARFVPKQTLFIFTSVITLA